VPRLYGFSPAIVPKPADWDGNSGVTGYWFLDDEGWMPPPSLREFLEAGPPPVYVGFGSIPLMDPVRTTAMVVEALSIAGSAGSSPAAGADWQPRPWPSTSIYSRRRLTISCSRMSQQSFTTAVRAPPPLGCAPESGP
jgi:hypothetical protein